ncbi:MAG: hypothetical protein R8G66_01350 [Cytophagales bacterium]|nr:hypothetical protein [Cytophagales bacterium]
MANSRSFGGVSAATWDCVKSTSKSQHGTVYAPDGASEGTATTDTVVGTIVLHFEYDGPKDTVTYTIKSKPFLVSPSQIWDGIQDTIDGCN